MTLRRSRIPYESIRNHIPENAWLLIWPLLQRYPLEIILWDHRQSKFGDYQSPESNGIHSISVNKSQNIYSFLITLVHELAHMEMYERFGPHRQPHGRDWKRVFRLLLMPFIDAGCFPVELAAELNRHMANPKATTASDPKLSKIILRYDDVQGLMLEDMPMNAVFRLENGMVFRKGEKRRSRYSCIRVDNRRLYYVSGMIRVEPLQTDLGALPRVEE